MLLPLLLLAAGPVAQAEAPPPGLTPERVYCLRVTAAAGAIIAGRDRGIAQGDVVTRALASDLAAREPQLRQDIPELARFVYETAPEADRNRLLSFIHDTWCMGHFEGRQ